MVNIPAIGAQTDEVDTARQRVADLQAQQEELARALEDTWVAQVLAEERLAATEDALRQAESDLWLAQSSLEQWAVRLYMDLTTGKSVSLLMVESPERFEAGVGYLQAVGGDEEEILNHYRSVTQELARQQTEHQSHLVELDEIRGEQETLFSQLIESLEAAQQELALLEALDSEQTESVPTTTTTRPTTPTTRPSDGYDYNGVCPVDEPNTFVDTWGAPRSGGRTHQGVDLLAERGTPVRAIHEGVLFRVDVGGLGVYTYGCEPPGETSTTTPTWKISAPGSAPAKGCPRGISSATWAPAATPPTTSPTSTSSITRGAAGP